jgi:hypothetical protein
VSILQNAVDSIELGVEDFQADDPKRLISSVRNFYAGLLLLFKHKLSLLSANDDEALLKADVLPVLTGKGVSWRGKGKKTVDVQQIRDRFTSLKITVDWSELDKIQDYRRNIEHYFTTTKPEVVRQYIAACFVVVRDFIVDHLKAEPRVVLGDRTWAFLVEQDNVHRAERERCEAELDRLKWPGDAARLWMEGAICQECGSDLLKPTASNAVDAESAAFECVACGHTSGFEDLLIACGSPHDTFASYKDGGGQIVGTCPECGRDGYDSVEGECALCGASGPYECAVCGNNIPIEELSWEQASLCGYCKHQRYTD